MASESQSTQHSPASDIALVALLDELAARLSAGEVPDWEVIRAQHPDQFSEIQSLLPVAQAMASLGEAKSAAHEAAATMPAKRLGDFQLIREIGRGGMGIVYEARQLSLGRRTALKVLPLASVLDPRQLQRFQNEARAAATLSHPHIVPVYSVGCEEGVHFIAMQLIEGRSLSDIIAALREQTSAEASSSSLPTGSSITQSLAGLSTNSLHDQRGYARSCAQLGIQIAAALEHAHHVGVVHRDIKPSNLLVDNQGQVWVADFGLAMLPGDTQLTMTGDLVGTLRYMSPEQIRGERGATDFRTDIYSLGITLYELLTLQPAFPAADRQALLRQVANDEPALPRRVRRGIPIDLETIIRKAIQREPSQRYSSARELADDLQRFLDQRPIKARPPSVADSVAKWVRRRPALAALGVVTLLATITLVVGQWRYSSRLQAALATTKAHEQELRRQVYPSHIRDAFTAISVDDSATARNILAQYRPTSDQPLEADLRGPEWYYLQRQAAIAQPRREFVGHQHAVHSAIFSPDEKQLATGDASGKIIIWDVASGKQLHAFAAHEGEVRGLAYSPDGTRLYSTGMGKQFRGWDTSNWNQLFSRYAHDGTATALAINRAGDRVATCGRDGRIRMWNPALDVEQPLWTVKSKNVVYDVEFADNDQTLLAVHKAHEVRALDVATGEERYLVVPGPEQMNLQKVRSLADGRQFVVAGNRSLVSILDLKTGQVNRHLEFSRNLPYALAASVDGRWLACGGHRGAIDIWETKGDLTRGYQRTTLFPHENHVSRLLFTRDNRYLLSAGDDHRVLLWELAQLPIAKERFVPLPLGNVGYFKRSPDNRHYAALAESGQVFLLDPRTFQPQRTFGALGYIIRRFAFSADSAQLATIDAGGRLLIWNTSDGDLVQELQVPDQGEQDVREGIAFSASGEELFIAGVTKKERGYLVRIDRTGGPPIEVLDCAEQDVEQLAQTPDFKHLLLADYNTNLSIIDGATGEMKRLPKSIRLTNRITVSDNGHYLAAGHTNETFISICDLATKKQHMTFPLPAADVGLCAFAFSPNGQRLAASSTDGYVRLFDVATMRQMLSFSSLLWTPGEVCFSADGNQLIATVSPRDPIDAAGLLIWPLK